MKHASGAYRGYVLFMLVLVYTFNFVDRQILGILAVPIQAELGLSDTQVGLMRGLSFALFYSTLGVPIALLADRFNRVWIMTIALALWSGMTAVCGLATNFWQLFLARLGVGVGEAGGVAPAYSIVTDYHAPDERGRALAIYSLGIPIGSAIGIIFGGVIAELIDWRAAFVIIGIAGVLFAPLFRLTVREPKRGGRDAPGAMTGAAPLGAVVKVLVTKKSFWLLCIGAASSSMMGYGLFAWLPAFFVRSYPAELAVFAELLPGFLLPPDSSVLLHAAYFYGTVVLIGGSIGIWFGGYLSDRLGKGSKRAYALVPGVAFLLTAPFFMGTMALESLTVTFFVLLIPTALGLAWLGPVLAAFQHIVPPNMRTTASAVFLLINNLAGIGFGDLTIGLLSDAYSGVLGEESLRYALMTGGVFYVVAAGFLIAASSFLEKDWER